MMRLCFGMKVLNVTQSSGSEFSHPNYCLDLAGSDAGVDFWYAQGNYWKCIAGPWGSGTYFFTACDSRGHPVRVRLANGRETVVTLAMTHGAYKYVKRAQIGRIYKNLEPMYEEGTLGQATGNHIHIEVAGGLHTSKAKDPTDGVYRMSDEIPPEEAFWVNESFTKIANPGGVKWRTCSKVEEE